MKNTNKMAQYDAPEIEVSLVQVEAGFAMSKNKFGLRLGSDYEPSTSPDEM